MRDLLRRAFHAIPPVKRLKRALEVREEAIEGLKRNLGEAIRERDSYAGHVMRLDRERAELAGLYEGAETARGEMLAHAERLSGERAELIQAVEALQAQLESAHRQVEALRGQRDELERERNDLKRYLERDQAELARMTAFVERAGATIPVAFPNGHFYSPVVKPDEHRLAQRLREGPRIDQRWRDEANGPMRAFYERLGRHREAISFLGSGRYKKENPAFWSGDAWVLAAMVAEFRPRRVIEVGCGYSSCVLMDLNDRLRAHDPIGLRFIDPFPETLLSLLEPGDPYRVQITASELQGLGPKEFEPLEENDILFLDTSHVVKTGGEVEYALNEILPALKPGVLVHIHDIFAGWEYPPDWVLDDHRSWSEIYMVRLLAEQGRTWRVEMFNDLCAKLWGCAEVAGSSLWLRKTT
jgi:regulator of replication initiation timing